MIQSNDYKMLKGALLIGSSLSMLAVSTPTFAQSAGDEVIVTGIRQSLENAIVEKREANSLVEVILAEDIGKLPDQNLAEVLENISGIQITREAGVGTGVQIRGADENRIEINGVTTVGSGNARGGINFEDVSSAIIAGIEVIKAPESSTIEGAVGGTINLRTIRPLDLNEDKPLVSGRLQFENSSLSNDGLQPRIEGALGKKWSTASGEEAAIVLSASYTQQDTTAFRPRADGDGDNIVDLNRANPGTTAFDFLSPQFFVQDLDNFEADTFNFAGTLEYAPSSELKFFADAIFTTQDRLQESSRIQTSGISDDTLALAIANDPNTVFETVDFGSIGGQEIGTIERAVTGTIIVDTDGGDGNLRFSSDTGSRRTDSTIFRIGSEWDVTDNLSTRIEFSQSDANSESPSFNTTLNFINPNIDLDLAQLRANQLSGTGISSNENGTPFLFDISGGSLAFGIADDPALGGVSSADLLNPSNVVLRDVQQNFDEVDNSETAIRFDASYDLENSGFGSFITSFDAGYRYNDTSSELVDIGQNVGLRSIDQSPAGDLFPELLVAGPNNFDDADGRDLFVPDFLLIDPELTNSNPQAVLNVLNDAILENNELFGFNGSTIDTPTSNQDGSFTISEETHALYAQANFEYGFLRGNAGVRYVNTNVTSSGFQTINEVTTVTNTEGSYDFILPRVNLIAEPIDDVLIRAAWSRDIRRPDFNDLSTSFSFSTSPNPDVEIGNPGLVPQEIQNFDVGVEWYFAPSSIFSIGYFRKERDGLFATVQTDPEETFTQIFDGAGNLLGSADVRDITDPCEGGGIFNPIADQNVFAPLDPVTGAQLSGTGVCVPISQVVNDPGTTTQQGIEVAFQYDLANHEDRLGWASGFGFIANYTYQEFTSSEETFNNASGAGRDIFEAANPGATNVQFPTTLLNNSQNAYNLTGYYEKYGLSARLRWTWRDAFRTDDFGSTNSFPLGFPAVQEARGQLNGSINYDVNEHLTIGVEAVNLTESDIVQRCVNPDGPVCFQGFTDRRIIFGGSYTF